jgi:hypothetical protein
MMGSGFVGVMRARAPTAPRDIISSGCTTLLGELHRKAHCLNP